MYKRVWKKCETFRVTFSKRKVCTIKRLLQTLVQILHLKRKVHINLCPQLRERSMSCTFEWLRSFMFLSLGPPKGSDWNISSGMSAVLTKSKRVRSRLIFRLCNRTHIFGIDFFLVLEWKSAFKICTSIFGTHCKMILEYVRFFYGCETVAQLLI